MKEEKNKRNAKVSNSNKTNKLIYLDKEKLKIEKTENNSNEQKLNKFKLAGTAILLIIILAIMITYIVYANNETFRNYLDEYVLRKDLSESSLQSIELKDYDKSTVFAYSKYIAVIGNNTLTTYNSSGKKEAELSLEITEPLITTSGKYALIAENNSTKMYMVSDSSLKWEKELEGNISRVTVNKSGYSAVILTGTAYKSVIILQDNSGNELFKTYLASTVAVDISISDDNKQLSYAEINTSGTLIQSNIKTIDIDKAKQDSENAITSSYSGSQNSLVLNIEYQNKNNLICMFDDSIVEIKAGNSKKITDINTKEEKITFSSIQLNNSVVKNIEDNSGILSTQTGLKIINTSSAKESNYRFYGVTKELYCSESKIALNLGSEVHFVATNGWLIKKYSSSQEIRKIVLSDNIAGIVYRNKIEIVKL